VFNQKQISIVDKSAETEAIKEKYGSKFFLEQEARKEAADLWGCDYNEIGILLNRQYETIVTTGTCKGEMNFIETRKGYWLVGCKAQTAIGGFGYAASVWDRQGFTSYEDARLFIVQKLIAFFSKEAVSTNSCSSTQNKRRSFTS